MDRTQSNDHHRWLEELYREYREIIWERKLKLRVPVLCWESAERRWGSWHPLKREIRISKELVANYPWETVRGVLKHEIAHQLVTEGTGTDFVSHAGDSAYHSSHGDAFQKACLRLGLAPEFSASTIEDGDTLKNWMDQERESSENDPTPRQKLMRRAQKLLNLSSSPEPAEAVAALKKVQELYRKYDLDTAENRSFTDHGVWVIHTFKKRIDSHRAAMVSLLTSYFSVQAIYHDAFEARLGERCKTIEILGTRANVLMAEYVYNFLDHSIEYRLDQELESGRAWETEGGHLLDCSGRPQINPTAIKHFKKCFRHGMISGFRDKLEALRIADARAAVNQSAPFSFAPSGLKPQVPTTSSGSTLSPDAGITHHPSEKALVAIAQSKLSDFQHFVFPRLRTKRTGETNLWNDDAYSSGHREGKGLNFRAPVEGPKSGLRRLLNSPGG